MSAATELPVAVAPLSRPSNDLVHVGSTVLIGEFNRKSVLERRVTMRAPSHGGGRWTTSGRAVSCVVVTVTNIITISWQIRKYKNYHCRFRYYYYRYAADVARASIEPRLSL